MSMNLCMYTHNALTHTHTHTQTHHRNAPFIPEQKSIGKYCNYCIFTALLIIVLIMSMILPTILVGALVRPSYVGYVAIPGSVISTFVGIILWRVLMAEKKALNSTNPTVYNYQQYQLRIDYKEQLEIWRPRKRG